MRQRCAGRCAISKMLCSAHESRTQVDALSCGRCANRHALPVRAPECGLSLYSSRFGVRFTSLARLADFSILSTNCSSLSGQYYR